MKCHYCGGEVASDAERCPFCDNINKEGIAYQKQLQQRIDFNESLKNRVIQEHKKEILYKILKRAILISALVLVINVVICVVAYTYSENGIKKKSTQQTSNEILTTFYQNKEFDRLHNYMDKQDLFGELYYTYSQIAFFYPIYDNFIEERNHCIMKISQKEQLTTSDLSTVFYRSYEFFHPRLGNFNEIQQENVPIMEEYKENVMAFLMYYLKLNKEEINLLTGDTSLSYETYDKLADSVLQRDFGEKD